MVDMLSHDTQNRVALFWHANYPWLPDYRGETYILDMKTIRRCTKDYKLSH